MNTISDLWDGINALLLTHRSAIGITSVEQAETGALNTIKAPGCATWIDFGDARFAGGGQLLSLPIEFYAFCVAAPEKNQCAAVNAALAIAIKVLATLSSAVVNGSVILPADKPLELIEKSSTKSVVAAMFTIDVRL